MRIYQALRNQGLSVDFKRLRRLLREHGIFHRYHDKYVSTTNSDHKMATVGNLLLRQFKVDELNKVWCGDITYLPTAEGWLYLASVIDLATRELIGFQFSTRLKTSIVVDALKSARKKHHPIAGCIFHSDQGSQYCSRLFRRELERARIMPSMSRRGQCWDNAAAESFWATLKRETLPPSECFASRADAEKKVRAWISYYNGRRPHSTLGGMSPHEYRVNHF